MPSGPALTVDLEDRDSGQSVADAIEGLAMCMAEPLSKLEVLDEFGPDPIAEDVLDSAWSNLARRSERLGAKYHLAVGDRVIQFIPSRESSVYSAIVLMGLADVPFRNNNQQTPTAALFDRIVAAIGPAMHPVGSARACVVSQKTGEGASCALPERLRPLLEDLGLELRMEYFDPGVNDGGVDVAVWRPIEDNRLNNPIALIQGTTQLKYRHKPRDVNIRQWGLALSQLQVISGFAIPFKVADKWAKTVSSSTNLVWHRPVLLDFLVLTPGLDASLMDDCGRFVNEQLA